MIDLEPRFTTQPKSIFDQELTPRFTTNHKENTLAKSATPNETITKPQNEWQSPGSFQEDIYESAYKFESKKRYEYEEEDEGEEDNESEIKAEVDDQPQPVARKINFGDEPVVEMFSESLTSNSPRLHLEPSGEEVSLSTSYGLRGLMASLQDDSPQSSKKTHMSFRNSVKSTGKISNQSDSDQEAEISACSGKPYYPNPTHTSGSSDQEAEISANFGLCSSGGSQGSQEYAEIDACYGYRNSQVPSYPGSNNSNSSREASISICSGENSNASSSDKEAEISVCSGRNHSHTDVYSRQEDDTFLNTIVSETSDSFDDPTWPVSPVAHKRNYDNDSVWFG